MQPSLMMMTSEHQENFIFWNCGRGVFNKKVFIEKYIQQFKPSLFFISVCDLKLTHCSGILNIEGYSIEISSTLETKGKGRLMAYVSPRFVRVKNLEEKGNDILVFDGPSERVVGVYSGFHTLANETQNSNFMRLISNLGKVLNIGKRVIIGGDFNAELSKANYKSSTLMDWQSEFGLKQIVSGITRERLVVNTTQSPQLDLVFTNDPDCLTSEVINTESSDHYLIKVNKREFSEKVDTKKRVVLDWKKYSENKLEVDNVRIQSSNSLKVLGITFDSEL